MRRFILIMAVIVTLSIMSCGAAEPASKAVIYSGFTADTGDMLYFVADGEVYAANKETLVASAAGGEAKSLFVYNSRLYLLNDGVKTLEGKALVAPGGNISIESADRFIIGEMEGKLAVGFSGQVAGNALVYVDSGEIDHLEYDFMLSDEYGRLYRVCIDDGYEDDGFSAKHVLEYGGKKLLLADLTDGRLLSPVPWDPFYIYGGSVLYSRIDEEYEVKLADGKQTGLELNGSIIAVAHGCVICAEEGRITVHPLDGSDPVSYEAELEGRLIHVDSEVPVVYLIDTETKTIEKISVG